MKIGPWSLKKPGLPPGELVFTGENHDQTPIRIDKISYNPSRLNVEEDIKLEDAGPTKDITWLSVKGIHDASLIGKIGESYGLHTLILEDVLNTQHRPKLEHHQDCIFLILKRPAITGDMDMKISHLALVIGPKWVISFQESGDTSFENILPRLNRVGSRLREKGADYLAYCLIDTLVDHYFPLLGHMDEMVDKLDGRVMERSWKEDILNRTGLIKKNALILWKVLWAMRDIGNQLQRMDTPLMSPKNHIFLRDMQDHISHQVELTEILRIRLDDLTNLYLNRISMRMNEIMKTLTIVGSIFIPLTFVAGIYGMNFVKMPGIESNNGFNVLVAAMVVMAIALLLFFKKRKWL